MSSLIGLTKLSDANNAGTRLAKDCTLILTEGDSAKALAVAGLGIVGRDFFGVFPLRGKLLNVREARHDQIMKNEEIQNIKKILGLQHNKDYSDVSSLRYGRLMIMADQVRSPYCSDDVPTANTGRIMMARISKVSSSTFSITSILHSSSYLNFWLSSLLPLFGYVHHYQVIRRSDRNDPQITKGKQRRDFFTLPEYEKWLLETPDAHKWDSKYYKACDLFNTRGSMLTL